MTELTGSSEALKLAVNNCTVRFGAACEEYVRKRFECARK